MFQYVRLFISSDVIMFHRRVKKERSENGKIKRKSAGYKGRKRVKTDKTQPEIKKKQRKKERNTKKTHKNGTKPMQNGQRKTCNMQSWERAVFCPRFLKSLYLTGRRFCMGDVSGAIHWDILER